MHKKWLIKLTFKFEIFLDCIVDCNINSLEGSKNATKIKTHSLKAAMPNISFSFVTNVANKLGPLPHFYMTKSVENIIFN